MLKYSILILFMHSWLPCDEIFLIQLLDFFKNRGQPLTQPGSVQYADLGVRGFVLHD